MTSLTVYDGTSTIGGNKIYLEQNEMGLFLDFGMNFAKYKDYFHDFLSERSYRGIHDLLYLDLIPKLDIYRRDLIPADLDVLGYPKLNINAMLLTHAHMDHYGNIGLLDESIPLIASSTSFAILKAIFDTTRSRIGSEALYTLKREINDEVVFSKQKKYIGRDLICTDKCTPTFECFMALESKSRREFECGAISKMKDPSTELVSQISKEFEISSYTVDHSIFGCRAYILRGDTTIAYTGDFRIHGRRAHKSKEFVNRAKNASVLVIEGTRASREEKEDFESESEALVYENSLKAVQESKGLVIADFTSRNIERLELFRDIAKQTGRQLVISPKDAYLLFALEQVDGINRIQDYLVYERSKSYKKYWEQNILGIHPEITYVDHAEINKDLERFLLCFSFYDMNNLLDIKPSTGSYIYSSSEAFEEEAEFDFIRMYNWIKLFDFKIYGFELTAEGGHIKPVFESGYHASGHLSAEDIKWVIDTIDPEVIIPVHTEHPQWFEDNFENAVLLKNGQKLDL